VEAGQAAARTKDTYLRALYQRIKSRQGHKKAIVAVGHSILVAAYHILSEGVPYEDLGGDYFQKRDTDAHVRRLVRQLERLGQKVIPIGHRKAVRSRVVWAWLEVDDARPNGRHHMARGGSRAL
jgi:hypothetical protein